ncbi:hypothetical protein BTA35_0216730, partial [Oceanospirillum linum]
QPVARSWDMRMANEALLAAERFADIFEILRVHPCSRRGRNRIEFASGHAGAFERAPMRRRQLFETTFDDLVQHRWNLESQFGR